MGTYDTRGGHPLHDPAADQEEPCSLCLKGECECQECPVCRIQGDPACYHAHGLDATRIMERIYCEQQRLQEEISERRARINALNRVAMSLTGIKLNTVIAFQQSRGHRPSLFSRKLQFLFDFSPNGDEVYPAVLVTGSPLTKEGKPSSRTLHRYGTVPFYNWKFPLP